MTPMAANPEPPQTRIAPLQGAALTVAAAVLWWALATWRDGTTFHLGPAIVIAAWAVVDRLQAQRRLTQAEAATRLGAGVAATLLVTVVLELSGRLEGPALVGGTALGETVLVAVATVVVAWLAVTTGRRPRT
jgi:hypothetical protein